MTGSAGAEDVNGAESDAHLVQECPCGTGEFGDDAGTVRTAGFIQSESAWKSDTATCRPWPLFSRPSRACRMPWNAVMPAAMSQTDTPTRAIPSSVPVIVESPLSAWTRRS